MAGKVHNFKLLEFNKVRFGRTEKCFENCHKPYANRCVEFRL
jgi:hypothetical protein